MVYSKVLPDSCFDYRGVHFRVEQLSHRMGGESCGYKASMVRGEPPNVFVYTCTHSRELKAVRTLQGVLDAILDRSGQPSPVLSG